MKKIMTSEEYKNQLDVIVSEFMDFYNNKYDYTLIIYCDWDAKDVLSHVVMWHESFSRNVRDIITGNKPNPLKGSLTDVNEKGVFGYKHYSVTELLEKMKSAHGIIMSNILNEKIELIPYKKGSRDYSRDEHMEVVYRHIKGHLTDLNNKYASGTI